MEKIGKIEIRVIGKNGNNDLSPNNYDIKDIASILANIEDLLYPSSKKVRPLITYNLEEGSVKHIFKTTIQTVISFSAILTQIQSFNSIDFLELKTARAIENFQSLSKQKNYKFEFKTSFNTDSEFELEISPETNFISTDDNWVDAEFYFYGTLKDAGGKVKSNIHLDTKEYGYIGIDTEKGFLENQKQNLLYKKFGVRAKGKQNSETGEVDTKSLSLVELIDYNPKFDNNYLKQLISKAKKNWKDVKADEWVSEIRGDYEV